MSRLTCKIEGMTCTNCAKSIELYLKKQGYKNVQVDFASETLVVEHDTIDPQLLSQQVAQLGYRLVTEGEKQRRIDPLTLRFIISAIFTLPLLLSMVIKAPILHHPYVQLALAIVPYGIGLLYFGKSAWQSIKNRYPNMDVLVIMGATAAFFYSLYGTFLGRSNMLFYETAATIITVILLGNLLEHRALKATRKAIADLMKKQPEKVKRWKQGKIEEVPASQVQVNDIVQINSGDTIALDGVLIEGSLWVNESPLTGESKAIAKKVGDRLLSGSVVLEGSGRMEVKSPLSQSFLSQVLQLLQQAGASKARLQQLADKISAYFVPTVVLFSIITFIVNLLWGVALTESFIRALAVLVIACPCALGLATPTAIAVALGKAAKKNLLIKDATVFEQLAQLQYFLMDKTGTLTKGQLKVKDVVATDSIPKETLVQWIVTLEQHSNHPIAYALRKHFASVQPQNQWFQKIEEVKGKGVYGITKNNEKIFLTSYKAVKDKLQEEKPHSVYILYQDKVVGYIDIEDELKADAKEFIQVLKAMAITPVLVSGDSKARCEAVAQALGIEQVYAGVLPQEKLAIIERYAKQGITAMLGDGINDAPALKRAHVGIAFVSTNQLAAVAADVIALKEDLKNIVFLLQLSRKTRTIVFQNLFWAFFYNVLAIPIAAVGLLHPMIAAFAMAFSDLIVVGNALRFQFSK